MATGNIETSIKEKRQTYYKLHPQAFSDKPGDESYAGLVIEMLNLPNDQYHWEMWRQKGYATNPQELMPQAKLVKTEEGEYKFQVEAPPSPEELVCGVCGKKCASKLGLQSHQKSHK